MQLILLEQAIIFAWWYSTSVFRLVRNACLWIKFYFYLTYITLCFWSSCLDDITSHPFSFLVYNFFFDMMRCADAQETLSLFHIRNLYCFINIKFYSFENSPYVRKSVDIIYSLIQINKNIIFNNEKSFLPTYNKHMQNVSVYFRYIYLYYYKYIYN